MDWDGFCHKGRTVLNRCPIQSYEIVDESEASLLLLGFRKNDPRNCLTSWLLLLHHLSSLQSDFL
jgi:hypothetical protein